MVYTSRSLQIQYDLEELLCVTPVQRPCKKFCCRKTHVSINVTTWKKAFDFSHSLHRDDDT